MIDVPPLLLNDHFARHLKIRVLEARPGHARVALDVKPHHYNGVDILHGGVIFTLADYAFAIACNRHDQVAVAVNANISYITTTKRKVLLAEATEITRGAKMASYDVRVFDDEDVIVASFHGLAYLKKKMTIEEKS